jgi:hypothetical protein
MGFLVCALALASLAEAGPPSWVRKPPRDTGRMLYAVGIASQAATLEAGRKEAIADALGDLARRVEAEVQTRFEAVRTSLSRQIEDEIRVRSPKARMAGSLVQAWDFEKERDGRVSVWVLLAMPKEALEREMQRQAEAGAARALEADELRRKGDRAAQEGRVGDALTAYLAALDLGGDPEVRARLLDLAGRLRLKAVPGAPAAQATLIVGGQGVPASGAPVRFLDAFGETVGASVTDGRGRVEAPPGVTEAQIDPAAIARAPEDVIRKLSVISVRIEAPKRGVRVSVRVAEMRRGKEVASPLVEGRIAAALAAAGFQVVAGGKADFRVEGGCDTRIPAERPFNLPTALAEVHLRAVRQDGEAVCFVDAPGVPGFGNDIEAAEVAALDNAAREVGRRLVEALSKP